MTRAVCTHLLLVRVGTGVTCLCGGAVPPWLEAIWRLYQDEQVRGRKLLKAFLDPKSYWNIRLFSVIELLHIPI